MSGIKNIRGAQYVEFKRGMGDLVDDGSFDQTSDRVFSVEANVTLAQLNAGKTIVPAVANRTYKPVALWVKFNGTFLTSTDIRLSDTNSSPVDILTIAIAQAGDGVKHSHVSGTNTLGAGFMTNLTANKGIQVRQTGTAATGGTSIDVNVLYRITT